MWFIAGALQQRLNQPITEFLQGFQVAFDDDFQKARIKRCLEAVLETFR
jgi:hypothetical protein